MDPAVVVKLQDAFKKALEDPGVLAVMDKYEMLPNYKSAADYTKLIPELGRAGAHVSRPHRTAEERLNPNLTREDRP